MRTAVAALAVLAVLSGCASHPGASAAAPPQPEPTAAPSPGPTAAPGAVPSVPAVSVPPTPAGPRPGETAGVHLMPVVNHGPRMAKRVALTFDADMTPGMREKLAHSRPDYYYNADLIATLRRLEVPATLFLTGLWMQTYPDVTRELAGDDLFELGTHSWDHLAFTGDCYGLPNVPAAGMLADVTKAVSELDSLDPRATRWFRFPGLCHDHAALLRTAAAGVTAVDGDVAGLDGHAASARAIADNVLNAVRPGSIVTMHMHGGDVVPLTDEAVAIIVPELRKRGYELVTVTQLLSGA